jgi:cytochrome c oxidase assembly factor CtaG
MIIVYAISIAYSFWYLTYRNVTEKVGEKVSAYNAICFFLCFLTLLIAVGGTLHYLSAPEHICKVINK